MGRHNLNLIFSILFEPCSEHSHSDCPTLAPIFTKGQHTHLVKKAIYGEDMARVCEKIIICMQKFHLITAKLLHIV